MMKLILTNYRSESISEFNWIKTDEVPNVSHQGRLMAQDAVKYLYPEN